MAEQIIDVGTAPNNGTGDPLRTAFIKTDENFNQIWAAGPVGSNVRIQGNVISTLQVNQDLALSPNGVGNVRLNNNTIPGANNTWFLGSVTNRWRGLYVGNVIAGNVTINSGLTVPGDAYIGGNLTVVGNTIQIGNITTDTLTIQLANTALTDAAANGAGITVGANDDIATFLYNAGNNVWTTNIGLQVGGPITGTSISVSDATIYGNIDAINGNFTGNVTANYFFGDGSQLTGMYGNANVTNFLANGFGSNSVITTGNITAGYFLGNGSQLTGIQTGAIISNTAPSLGNGGIWWNSVDGRAYVKYANAFIDLSPSLVPDPTTYVGNVSFDDITVTNVGNIIPAANAVYSLGSEAFQWSNLWVANNTIYLGGVPLGITAGNVLTINGEPILSNDSNTSITTTGNITANVITATESADLGSLNFYASVISMNDDVWDNIFISPNGESYAYLSVPKDSVANVQDVRLHNDAGNVEIGTNGGINTWLFDGTGNLTIPNGGYINFVNTGGLTQALNEDLTFTVSDDEEDGWAVTSIVNDGAGTELTRMQVRYDGIRINTDVSGLNYSWDFRDSGEFDVPKSIRGPVGANLIISIGDQPASDTFIDLQTRSYVGDALISNIRIANPNVSVSTASGAYNWTFDATGNLTAPGNITTTANVTAAYFIGDGSQLTGLPPGYTDSDVATFLAAYGSNTISTTGNITAGNFVGAGSNVDIVAGAYDWTFGNDGNLLLPGNTFAVKYANGVAVSLGGNYSDANVVTLLSAYGSNTISTTGNITGGYILGNAAFMTGIPASYGNANVVANLAALGSNPISSTANITTTGNVSGAYVLGNGSQLTSVNAVTVDVTNTNGLATTYYPTFVENRTTAQIARADVDLSYRTDTNTLTVGNISSGGNITAAYFIGNGSALTGVTVNTVGNITGTSSNVDIIAGAYQWTFNNTGNLVLPGNTFAVNYANGTAVSLGGGGTPGGADTNVQFNDGGSFNGTAGLTFNKTSNALATTGSITGGSGANIILGNATSYLKQNSSNASVNLSGSVSLVPDTSASALNGVVIGGSGYVLASNSARVLTLNTNNSLTVAGNLTLGGSTGFSRFTTLGETTTGVNAIVAGQGPTILANSSATFTANVNNYTQITFQNKNTGADATADYILTADNGTDTVNYGDFGIINSGYDNATPTNSLGNIVFAADTYIYAQGNIGNTSQSGGNLVIGTTTATKNVKIFAGGTNNNSLIANISSTGLAVTGAFSATGNISAGNLTTTGLVSATGNVTGGNLTTTGQVTATGNVSAGNVSVTGNITGNTGGFAIGYRDIPQLALSANTTVSTSDAGKHYYSTSASALTLTIANNASQAFQTGATINIINQGVGNVSILRGSGVTMYLAGNSTSSDRTLTSYGVASVTKVATDTWFISGVGLV